MDSGFNEDKGSFQPHKINKNDNYGGSLARRNTSGSDFKTLGSGPLVKLVNTNVNICIENYWKEITYDQRDKCPGYSSCNGGHGTCVLFSFAIAAYPFVKKDFIEYFKEVCNYYNGDLNTGICPVCYCSKHWGCLEIKASNMPGLTPCGGGYKALWMLIEKLGGVFEECKNLIDRSYYSCFSKIKNLLIDGCTSIVSFSFYNEEKDVNKQYVGRMNDAHSIAVAYSERLGKFIVRDPNINEVKHFITIDKIQEHCKDIYGSRGFSGLGECIVLKKKTN